jgi:glutaconate CoA-transferase subunit B
MGGAEHADRIRREQGWLGRGPSVVVTDLGIWRFDETGEMRLDSLHPGSTIDQVRETIAWEPKISPDLRATPPPTATELRIIREELGA